MKTLFKIAILAALLSIGLSGQTVLSATTLNSAVTSTSTRNMVLANCTGVVVGTQGYTDRESWIALTVTPPGTTGVCTLTVQRGASGTAAGTHVSGALTFTGPPAAFNQNPRANSPSNGSCTRTNELYLPLINFSTGSIADCLGGQWIKGLVSSGTVTSSRWKVYAPETGGTIYTSLNTNGTAVGNTTLYCTEVWLPTSKNLTGIGVLNGTTVTGNARYVVLYDSGGTPIANSALAGQASVTASIYENYPFVANAALGRAAATYFAVGPAQYFACLQDNAVGSTTVRMAITQVNDQILTKGQTAATFGTIPTLTVPTTFTTAVGPYVYLY